MRIEQKLSVPLFLITIGNFIKWISESGPFSDLFIWVLPFLVVSIMLMATKVKINHRILSIFLLFLSFFSIVYSEKDSIEGIFYLLYSLYISTKNKKTYFIYGITSVIAIMTRFYILNIGSSSTINYIAGGVFIVLFYFHYIHPKPVESQPENITLKSYKSRKVKDDVVDIVHLRTLGFNWDEINDKLSLCVTDDRVRRIVADERKRLGFKNQDQLVLWMLETGILKPISDNLIREA